MYLTLSGTGKTRTVLGMIYRFLKTNRFKRILFLVDRTSLGDQASVPEQEVIANMLDDMFSKEMKVKDTAEAVIDQIDTMKKAVLARAFRGELGTNDPAEESAMELLKSVL